MAANFSVGEVVEILARDEEMDVHVQEEAGEEVTLTERITECLKEVGDAESNKVYGGLCRAIRIIWRQQKGKNNFLFFIKTRQTAAFNSFWPDRA